MHESDCGALIAELLISAVAWKVSTQPTVSPTHLTEMSDADCFVAPLTVPIVVIGLLYSLNVIWL